MMNKKGYNATSKRSISLILQLKTHFNEIYIFTYILFLVIEMHEYSYWVLLIYANKILLAAILDDEIANPVAMVGGIGAALVILLVAAAGAILYRYICVRYSFWSIIFYIKFLLVVVTGVLSSTLMFASCGSWSIIFYINVFASCGSWSIIFFQHYKLSTCLPVGIVIVPLFCIAWGEVDGCTVVLKVVLSQCPRVVT